MKQGRTINELALELHRQKEAMRDYLLPANQIEAFHDNGDLRLQFDSDNNNPVVLGVTDNGHKQLGQYCNIPAKYYDLMKSSSGFLLASNVKHWLNYSQDRRMIRTLDGNARAFLSDRYRRLDNWDIANGILPLLAEAEATVESCEVTENKLYLKAVTHKVQGEVAKGDVVSSGIMISNSETGHGSLSVKPFLMRLVCTNGMVVDDYSMRKYHAGRSNDMEQIEFSKDTQLAEDTAFWLKVRDLVNHTLQEESFERIVNSMRISTEKKITEPEMAIEIMSKKHGLNQDEQKGVLHHLIKGGELSSWGLANAVTETSKEAKSYDRATELELIGYHVSQRNWN